MGNPATNLPFGIVIPAIYYDFGDGDINSARLLQEGGSGEGNEEVKRFGERMLHGIGYPMVI